MYIDDKGTTWCTVGYVLDKRIETGIHEERITVTMMPFKDLTSFTRRRRNEALDAGSVVLLPDREIVQPDRTSLEWLEWGLKTRTHEKKGWLKEKLLEYDLLEANEEALWKRVISDYKCQMAAIKGMRLVLGLAFKDPRDYKGVSGSEGKFVSVKKDSQRDIPKNMWTIPYLLHAYDVKRSNFQNKRSDDKKGINRLTEGLKRRTQYNVGDCVITNRAASQRMYTARYFFSRAKASNPAHCTCLH
jgi:hypothetical protein